MRRGKIELRSERHDAAGIDLFVAAVIVPLDVIHVHGLGHARHLVEITEIVREVRIVGDPAQVAFEMADIDGVETHQRGEEPPVRFGRDVADQIAGRRQPPLDLVEGRKQRAERLLVGGLGGGEAGTIDAVVDVGIHERIDAVDLLAQRRRIVIGLHVGQGVEGRVEHPDDFRRFVVDDGAALLVPQHRHRDASGIVRIRRDIDLR